MYYIVRLNKFQVVVATPSHTCTKYYTSALWIFMKGTCTNIQSFYLLSAVQYKSEITCPCWMKLLLHVRKTRYTISKVLIKLAHDKTTIKFWYVCPIHSRETLSNQHCLE